MFRRRYAARHSASRSTSRRRLAVESLEVRRVLTAWHNDALPTDVDGSGVVAPLDALLVINELVNREFSNPQDGMLPANRPDEAPFLDVTDNSIVAPLDALLVINDLGEVASNVFTILETAATDSLVGRIQPSGGVNANSIFELKKDTAIPASIRDILELRPEDHYQGAADAAVVLIEYVDFACPICGIFHPLVQQALSDFEGQIAVVTRHLPLTEVHPNAPRAAIAAEAAGRQGKFDEMADLLFTRRTQTGWDAATDPTSQFEQFADELGLNVTQFSEDLNDPALAERVAGDREDAVSGLGFTGTPSFVLNDFPTSFSSATQTELNDALQSAIDEVEIPFKIDRLTGEIRVRDGALLDYETNPTYTYDVMVNGMVETVEIRLTDVPGA